MGGEYHGSHRPPVIDPAKSRPTGGETVPSRKQTIRARSSRTQRVYESTASPRGGGGMRKGVGITHNVFGDLDRITWVRGWSFRYECSIQAIGCEPAR